MSNNDSPEWAKRDARLYLHLAERFGWTPEQINSIDQAVRFAMAKDLGLLPSDDEPAKQNPDADAAEPEGLAEWERDLLAKQDPEGLPTAPGATTSAQDAGITLNVHLDGKRIYDAVLREAQRYRRLNGPGLA